MIVCQKDFNLFVADMCMENILIVVIAAHTKQLIIKSDV